MGTTDEAQSQQASKPIKDASEKHHKKSKKHSKNASSDEHGRPKSKKHKKVRAEGPGEGAIPEEHHSHDVSASLIERPTDVSIKKKKKRSKDESKRKKIDVSSSNNSTAEVTKQEIQSTLAEVVSRKALTADLSNNSVGSLQLASMFTQGAQDDLMVPISPELPGKSELQSPAVCQSPAGSSRSQASSHGSRSSYERTPRSSPRRRRTPERQGIESFHGSRQRRAMLEPRRTFVSYRRASHSRDSSPGVYYPGSFSHRHSDRYRDSSRPRHTGYNRHSDSRHQRRIHRRSRSRSDSVPRRTPKRSRSRSRSGCHDRRQRNEQHVASGRVHRSPGQHHRSAGSRKRDSEHRSRPNGQDGKPSHPNHHYGKKPRSPSDGGKGGSKRPRSSDKDSPRHAERIETKSADSRTQRSDSGTKHLTNSPKSVSQKSDMPKIDEGRKVAEISRRGASSRSPKSSSHEKSRSHRLRSNVSALTGLLNGVRTEDISDTELTSTLSPEVFTKAFEEQLSVCSETEPLEKPHPSASVKNEPSISASDALKSSLDKLSSKIREQLSGPELWDTVDNVESPLPDELDSLDSSHDEQSLVGLASVNKPSQSKTSLTCLYSQWQELIDSTNTNPPTSTEQSSIDFVTSFVPVENVLNFGRAETKLLSLRRRAHGALFLPHIGVSHRFLGPDLVDCLQNVLARSDEADHHAQETLPQADTKITHSAIAWMQRTPHLSSLDKLASADSLATIVKAGSLSSVSDKLLRRRLLGIPV